MSLIGLRRRPGRWLPVRPTLWGWCLIFGAVMLGGGIWFAEYSMQPEFCRSCHLMEPYYQAWHESTHNDVACVQCHFVPGLEGTIEGKFQATNQLVKYVTGMYGTKPHAEVRDASCMREGCHARRLLEGNAEWKVATHSGEPITIHFDHTPHLTELRRGKQLRCVSCHSQIVQGQHIVVTLDTCFLCHFKELEHGRDDETLGGCGSCHGPPKGTVQLETGPFEHAEYIDRGVGCENCHANAIAGDGRVPRQQCWTCHNQPEHLRRYDETRFIHQNHVTDHKVECEHCHIQIEHRLDAAPQTVGSLASTPETHAPTDAGGCASCHEGSHGASASLYRGTGGRGVPDMPSKMHRAQVDCLGCHQQPMREPSESLMAGQSYRAAQESCDKCHGSDYEDRLAVWTQSIRRRLQRAEQMCTDAADTLNQVTLEPRQELELRRLLDDARHNVRFVRTGKGVHNVTYATALLNVAIENCQRIGDTLTAPTARLNRNDQQGSAVDPEPR